MHQSTYVGSSWLRECWCPLLVNTGVNRSISGCTRCSLHFVLIVYSSVISAILQQNYIIFYQSVGVFQYLSTAESCVRFCQGAYCPYDNRKEGWKCRKFGNNRAPCCVCVEFYCAGISLVLIRCTDSSPEATSRVGIKIITLLKNLTLWKRNQNATAVLVSIAGKGQIDNRHGEDRQSPFHCPHELSIADHWSGGYLRTIYMQPCEGRGFNWCS